ncbi:MAG: VTT domain-containing protein [Cyanobacteria bacterium]|nr:VTT domain-containing protein [Cyanobacteriota bacterium]
MIAAAVEGEIAYIAVTLVASGQLNAIGVLVSGTIGAALGDQAFFFAFRGRLPRWLSRYPWLQQRAAPLVERVRRRAALMVLLIRFAPGLRIAIIAACAWADVPPRKFAALNLLSALVWASAVMALVGWFGPAFFAQFGLGGWKGALIVGAALFGLLKVLGWFERRALERPHSVNS